MTARLFDTDQFAALISGLPFSKNNTDGILRIFRHVVGYGLAVKDALSKKFGFFVVRILGGYLVLFVFTFLTVDMEACGILHNSTFCEVYTEILIEIR